jgi:hypothetical protein
MVAGTQYSLEDESKAHCIEDSEMLKFYFIVITMFCLHTYI